MEQTKQTVFLKSMLISQLLMETIDQLKHTKQYRQDIKNQTNRLEKMLEQYSIREFDIIYKTDPEMTTNIMNKIESLVDKISTSSIEDLVMINAVIEKYNENKEWFREHGRVEFLKID
tara:strand:+ start:1281 stop:1634 length:354 start_codon:yes stop_codon:yes gene_type:complete